MTNEIKQGSPRASWKELLTKPDPRQTAILALYFFASCLVVLLAEDQNIATVYMLACVCLYYGMNRTLRSLVQYALPTLPLILLSGVLPVPNLMVLPCVYVALLVGGSTGAFLLTHHHKPRHLLAGALLCAAAYGAVVGLTGLPSRALLILLPAVLALAAGLALLWGAVCKDAVLIVATTLIVAAIAAGLVTLAVRGQLHGNILRTASDRIYDYVFRSAQQAEALYAQAGLTLDYSEQELRAAASSVINLAPGIVLALCGTVAFLLWRSLMNMLTAFKSLPRLTLRMAGFGISRTSAVVFLGAVILSTLSGDAVTQFNVVCDNLTLALIPGLALIGVSALFGKGKERSCMNSLISLGLILMLYFDAFSALTLAAAFGAVTVLLPRPLPPDRNQDNQKGER